MRLPELNRRPDWGMELGPFEPQKPSEEKEQAIEP